MAWPSEQPAEPEKPRFEEGLTFEELPKFLQEDILQLRRWSATIPALKQLPVWKPNPVWK